VTDDERLNLIRTNNGSLGDVVIRDVSMFRAEMLDQGHLWLSCYLPGTGVEGDRVTFEVIARGKTLEFRVGEMPSGDLGSSPP
jgi:hypothetical protein